MAMACELRMIIKRLEVDVRHQVIRISNFLLNLFVGIPIDELRALARANSAQRDQLIARFGARSPLASFAPSSASIHASSTMKRAAKANRNHRRLFSKSRSGQDRALRFAFSRAKPDPNRCLHVIQPVRPLLMSSPAHKKMAGFLAETGHFFRLRFAPTPALP
ncbi:hypothetical protein EOS_12955 [Caballeronia mineralivorans PML1(12)]|uniref:Uncharacterized protein n=1 Tax=Caballeronia mineralivorans PML1(12) TaxID=908627 RepID=A0A0J1CZK1_9BURK|nr:hypothetical protein EOS_12955 [Caballeronia mineralivorans PML1(12)]